LLLNVGHEGRREEPSRRINNRYTNTLPVRGYLNIFRTPYILGQRSSGIIATARKRERERERERERGGAEEGISTL